VGVYIDMDNQCMHIYKNYDHIRNISFNSQFIQKLDSQSVFPCVALCGDIHVTITHKPSRENYKTIIIQGENQTVVGERIEMEEFLDTLGIVKFKEKLMEFTLEGLSLEVLERMQLPTWLKNKIWNARSEILLAS